MVRPVLSARKQLQSKRALANPLTYCRGTPAIYTRDRSAIAVGGALFKSYRAARQHKS
jgi:hypothetical protein